MAWKEMMDLDAKDWDSQVAGSKETVLVDFWHDACVWCKRLDPELAEVAKDFSGKLKFARFNIFSNDENSKIAEKYGIMGTPTLLLFCKGRVVASLVGYMPRAKLREKIQEMTNTYQDCFTHSTPVTQ
jgi:thioredoxin 1